MAVNTGRKSSLPGVKNVYWVIICPNSWGANGRMKGRAQAHTYA